MPVKIHEEDEFYIIRDINPRRRNHYLVVSNIHTVWDAKLIGRMIKGIDKIFDKPKELRINHGSPYQEIPHLHIHVRSDYDIAQI